MVIPNGNGGEGADVEILGVPREEAVLPAPTFVSQFLANIKWVAIGAAAGYAACWLMSKRKK